MCGGFTSSLSCSCREPYGAHDTVFETREERQAQGRPVDNLAGGGAGYEALGGLTSFSSLVDGVDRLALGAGEEPRSLQGGEEEQQMQPPLRKGKLTAEDEFALYDAKYKGKATSSSMRRSGASAASSSSRGGGAAAEFAPEQSTLPPGGAPATNDPLSLFCTSVHRAHACMRGCRMACKSMTGPP